MLCASVCGGVEEGREGRGVGLFLRSLPHYYHVAWEDLWTGQGRKEKGEERKKEWRHILRMYMRCGIVDALRIKGCWLVICVYWHNSRKLLYSSFHDGFSTMQSASLLWLAYWHIGIAALRKVPLFLLSILSMHVPGSMLSPTATMCTRPICQSCYNHTTWISLVLSTVHTPYWHITGISCVSLKKHPFWNATP